MTKEINTQTGSTTVLTEGVYDKLKPTVMVWLPAIASLYFGLAQIWRLPAAEEVVGSIALLTTFLGTTLRVSSNRYHASGVEFDGAMVVQTDGGGIRGYSMELNDDPELLANKDKVTFKVFNNPVD